MANPELLWKQPEAQEGGGGGGPALHEKEATGDSGAVAKTRKGTTSLVKRTVW